MIVRTCYKYDQKAYPTDAANDDGGPALEQHCPDVSRRPYSQPRAVYTREDNVCVSVCVVFFVLSA